MQIRLDKYMADAGYGTRSAVRDLVRKGHVTVNGVQVRTPDQKIDTASQVLVDGTQVFYEEVSYYLLYKPAGILSASRDGREKTVVDLIPEPKRRDLFPVGRLDRDTVGLLLITNDGKLSNRLLAPGKHVEKTYRAVVAGDLPEGVEDRFLAGLDIGDEKDTAPARLRILGEMSEEQYLDCMRQHGIEEENRMASLKEASPRLSEVELVITEGRFHQVKRMFEAVGCSVIFLKRISMGKLSIPEDMKPGEIRKLTEEDIGKMS